MDGFACDQYFVGFLAGMRTAALEARQIPYCVANAEQIKQAFMEIAARLDAEMLKNDATAIVAAGVKSKFSC